MNKFLMFLVLIIAFTTQAIAEQPGLSAKLFEQNEVRTTLLKSGVSKAGNPSFNETVGEVKELHPGKALVLSAIMPGAGQFYAGNNLRAALFFAIEVAAWTGVIYYYNQGQEKEDEFEIFADDNFDENVYRGVEYALARDPQYGNAGAYPDDDSHDYDTWTEEDWDEKIKYLPDGGFTHELPTEEDRSTNSSDLQQYYEMIGKYIHQFGYGWRDVWSDPQNPVLGTFIGDDPNTGYYDNIDGAAVMSKDYMEMRHDSNQMLDYSAYAMQAALLNHVAAALEASFSVRAMNRKAKAQVGFRPVYYKDHLVTVGGLNFTW